MMFRDRDAPVSKEGIIFRVYGYDHPPHSCICDVEYASEEIYRSGERRAIRVGGGKIFYKFYFDGGLKFVKENYPQYSVFYRPLKRTLVGLHEHQVSELRRPDIKLKKLFYSNLSDPLINSLRDVLDQIFMISNLKLGDFGVFGSILHDFYDIRYSDLDFIVYGSKQLRELREVLSILYRGKKCFRNEFEDNPPRIPHEFKFYDAEEYPWYQRRKLIYGVYKSRYLNREVKIEFEPVKKYSEIRNEYHDVEEIKPIDWIKAVVKIKDDSDSFFMPSVYGVEVEKIDKKFKKLDIRRVISFVEEFRGQVFKDEICDVSGRLEKVITKSEEFYQITLSYGPKYFDQVLKLHMD